MQDFILIFLGLILWVFGANWLLKGAMVLSLKYNIPKIIVGMAVVSLATSLPELLLGPKAIMEGVPDLALKIAMGSNMANLGLLLAMALILSGIEVPKTFYRAKWSVLMLATTLFFGFIYFDGEIQRFEGLFMLVALFLLLIYLLWFQRKETVFTVIGDDRPLLHRYGALLFLGLGGLALWGGSEILLGSVWKYVVPNGPYPGNMPTVLLSIGVAGPESIVALIAIIKKQKDILLGNLMGANIYNLLAVLGISARIGPIKVMDPGLLTNDILWLMGISLALLPLLFFSRGSKLDWKSGSALLLIYLTFVSFTLI